MVYNDYIPFSSQILEVIKHTDIEYTFRMAFCGDVKPGQFFEVSIPKYGEAPISVSGIGDGYVDLTIRRVGKVTNEVFEHYEGDSLLMRGPYGNGFDVENFKGEELVIIAGGTGAAPVRGVIQYFAEHPQDCKSLTALVSFKKENEILFRDDFARWSNTANILLTMTRQQESEKYLLGRVTNHIPNLRFDNIKNAVAIVVGPADLMQSAVAELLKLGFQEKNIWISEERKMCCGLGKCGHCKVGKTYICLEGPVFNYTEGKKLMD